MRKLAALFPIPVPGWLPPAANWIQRPPWVALVRYLSDTATGLVTQTHACACFRSTKGLSIIKQLPVGTESG